MNPRKPLFVRQVFAQAHFWAETGFAPTQCFVQDTAIGGFGPFGPAHHDCYPFPSSGPDRMSVGPFFSWQAFADSQDDGIFKFSSARFAVESDVITTTIRGSLTCVKPSFSLPFCPRRLLAACKTPRRAALPVRLLVRRWPTLPTTTPLPALSLAALPVLHRAACRRPSAPATDLIAARAASHLSMRPVGASPRLAVRFSAPRSGQIQGREPCLKKS